LALPGLDMQLVVRMIGVPLCAGFVALNLLGAKEAARLQVALVLGLFALMLLYIARGASHVNVQHFEPFAPNGVKAIFSTAGFVFVSYGGLLKIASMAEEVRNPGRTIPLALIFSLLVASVFYALMVFVTSGVLGADKLDGSLTPISDGAGAFMGRGGKIALSVGAMLAFISTANAGIMAASRYLLALSRDRLLPDAVGKVGARYKTPHVAILITGALVAVALFLKLDILAKVASTVLILSYVLANVSVIILRESGLQNYRPIFRSPLYPWVQIAGIVGLTFVILEMGEVAFLISAILVVLGFAIYWFYGREKAHKESALLHLVERITAKELVTGTLEAELKEIIRERDEIVQDRFDAIIEKCVVLDIDESLDVQKFFEMLAEKIAGRVGMTEPELARQLIEREKENSTVLTPCLAIPHIVIKGEKKFDILLARAREGIAFSEEAPRVHAAFILLGTRDERNFHLRSLAAIAQIVEDEGFEQRWMAARNEQALRDIVLLGERKRP